MCLSYLLLLLNRYCVAVDEGLSLGAWLTIMMLGFFGVCVGFATLVDVIDALLHYCLDSRPKIGILNNSVPLFSIDSPRLYIEKFDSALLYV